MDTNSLIKTIEQETLELIQEQLEHGEMTEERAHEVANFVVTSLKPNMSFEQLYDTVKSFDDQFPELRKVVIDISNEYNTAMRSHIIEQVNALLAKKDIQDADKVLDEALQKEEIVADNILPYKFNTPVQIVNKYKNDNK